MVGSFVYALVTLFVILDPIGCAAIFAALTPHASSDVRRRMALRGTVIAGVLLLAFAFGGQALLSALGISLPAFRIAGGILLFLLATDMVFARHSGIRNPTGPEQEEAAAHPDVSVFPLAFPLIAGPGGLTSVVLLVSRATTAYDSAAVILALVTVLATGFVALLGASTVVRLLGITGANVISRVLGVILAALATQLVLDGLAGALPH